MLYSIQTFLEDFFYKRSYVISDNYVIEITKTYYYERKYSHIEYILSKLNNIPTVFYHNNIVGNRKDFESFILKVLDRKYYKRLTPYSKWYKGGLTTEKEFLSGNESITVETILTSFKHSTESKLIDVFWKSRKKSKLKPYPEKTGQALFDFFVYTTLPDQVKSLREPMVGIGDIDFVLIINGVKHLVEIKVITSKVIGFEQLDRYMEIEKINVGYLMFFDSLPPGDKLLVPPEQQVENGIIYSTVIDINPPSPSGLNKPLPK